MAITDLQISEELMTDAPSIKYRGDEGPKSPQEEQQMMVDALLKEEYNNYVYDLLEQRPDATPMSFEEFKRMVIAEGQMSGGQPLPEDPTKPVNPFQPKPIGPVLPDKREMAAYGGIMGADGRRQYGIGSFFQELKDKVVDDLIPNEIKDNPLLTAALVAGGDQLLNQGRITNTVLDSILGKQQYGDTDMEPLGRSGGLLETIKNLGTGAKDATVEFLGKQTNPNDPKSKTYGQAILSGIGKNIIPILGGVGAGLFTKNQPEQPGLPDDTTALQLADLKKGANLATQAQGLAANLNFLPAVEARLFSPAEMAIKYAQSAANGGRIGFENAGPVVDEQTTAMILDMNSRGMDVDTISTMTQTDTNTVNAILSAQNQKAEGGIMDLGGMEKDYRNTGGFVEIGAKEKADDVPARLSVNEFVFTADAVRNAGGGDIDEGAKIMENVMKHLEGGGQMSRESQGMAGARDMFATSQRLSEVV